MNITANNSAFGLAPSADIPTDAIEVIFDGSTYKCAVPDEFYSPNPTSAKIVNVFVGSKVVEPTQYSIHASGFGTSARNKIVSGTLVRTHDWYSSVLKKNMRWRDIEISKGVYDWSAADIFVNSVYNSGRTVFWTLGPCTPKWAAARPTENNAYGLVGLASEPLNMQDWVDFCAALASRYGEKITHYQLWNEFDLIRMYTGSNSNMALMTRLASQTIKGINPKAKIVGPSISLITTEVDGGTATQKLIDYFATSDGMGGTAIQWLDIIGVHMYAVNWTVTNWYMIPMQWQRVVSNIKPLIGSRPVWDTEMGLISVNLLTSGSTGDIYLARRMLLNAVIGVDHSIYYDIYSGTDGIMLDPDGTLVKQWEYILSILDSGPITVANIINNEKLAIVINGVNYLF